MNMKGNITMTQVFHKMNFDLKGHLRSYTVISVFDFLENVILLKVEIKLFFDIFSLKFFIYSKLSQNASILKSRLTFFD